MKHILCCVDGSDHADVALASVAELAKNLSVDLSILIVNPTFGHSLKGPQVLIWTENEAQATLAEASEKATANGLKLANTTVVVAHDVSTGIIDHALAHGIDAIVVGTGNKRGLSRLFLGSVAMEVAKKAPCTVIIAR